MQKGQITLYLVIGVLALIVVSMLMQRPTGAPIVAPQEAMFDDAVNYMRDCLTQSAQASVDHLALTGDILTESTVYIKDVPRAIFRGEGDVPTLDAALEMIREDYLADAVYCSSELPFDYEITASAPTANLSYSDGRITFYTYYPLTVTSSGKMRKVFNFAPQIDYTLQEYLDSARLTVGAFLVDPDYLNVTQMNLLPMKYNLGEMEGNLYDVRLYNESDMNSNYAFAVEVPQ